MTTQPKLDTLIVTQPLNGLPRLCVHRIGEADATVSHPSCDLTIPLNEDREVTAVDVGTVGVTYADDTGRAYLTTITTTVRDNQADSASLLMGDRATVWVGSLVSALAVTGTQQLLTGDTDGLLKSFNINDDDNTSAPALIATADKSWLSLLPTGDGGRIAVAIDGTWACLNSEGALIVEGKLPVSRGVLLEAHYSMDHQLLVYRTCAGETHSVTSMDGHIEWQAYSLADRVPVRLPDSFRFAPVLTATHGVVLAFNEQGGSWMGVLSGAAIAVRQLAGWPAGTTTGVTPLDDRPVVLRLDRHGMVQAFGLEDDHWHLLDLAPPAKPVAGLWAAESGAWSHAVTELRQRDIDRWSVQAYDAHKEDRCPERDELIRLLSQTEGGAVRAALLQATCSKDSNRWHDAVAHLNHAVQACGGLFYEGVQQSLGHALCRIGDLPGLSVFSQDDWPDVFVAVPEGIASRCRDLSLSYLIDVNAPDPPEGCSWSEHALPALKRWGSPSPCWLGAEREPPLALRADDFKLLPQIMKVCGASHTALRVLPPDGALREHEGWVFSEAIGGGMHRQLIAWPERTHGVDCRLVLCWAVRAEHFASPSKWAAAWDAVHQFSWRDDMLHLVEIIHQSLAHRVVPDASLLDHDLHRDPKTNDTDPDQEAA